MSDDTGEDAGAAPAKKKSKAVFFGLVAAVLLGGASFYGVYSGLIPLPFGGDEPAPADGGATGGGKGPAKSVVAAKPFEPGAFVKIDPLVISLGKSSKSRHLKVAVTIEVVPGRESEVTGIAPRIIDVLNTYLRAVDEREFEVPRAMVRLRAQMLRRVRLVAPPGAVRDLLIQQFVLN